jgi:hypothetical protein
MTIHAERHHLAAGYSAARDLVVVAGYGPEIDWAEGLQFVRPDAVYVMREAAHVIMCSGFRVAVVHRLWPALTNAFEHWKPRRINRKASECRVAALKVFRGTRKIDAIIDLAGILTAEGYESIVSDAAQPQKLRRLPYIGPITCYHLAKNLGADVVKPDVHLQRAAAAAGFGSPLELCQAIQRANPTLRERLTVIDSVLWRYGEQQQTRGWPSWSQLFDYPKAPGSAGPASSGEVPGARGGESSGALPTRLCRWVKSVPRAIDYPTAGMVPGESPGPARLSPHETPAVGLDSLGGAPLADRAKSAVGFQSRGQSSPQAVRGRAGRPGCTSAVRSKGAGYRHAYPRHYDSSAGGGSAQATQNCAVDSREVERG